MSNSPDVHPMRDEIRSILETLTEQATTHMMNMKLAPELTQKLIQNAEERAMDALTSLFESELKKELQHLKDRVDYAGTGRGFRLDTVYFHDFGSEGLDDQSTIYKKEVSDYLAARLEALQGGKQDE